MSNLTRRAMLRGSPAAIAAAVTAITLPAVATAAAPPPDDSPLLHLEAEHQRIVEEEVANEAAAEVAESSLPDWARHELPTLDRSAPDALGLAGCASPDFTIHLSSIRSLNRSYESIVADWQDIPLDCPQDRASERREWMKRRRLGNRRVRWWKERMQAITDARARAGVTALDEAGAKIRDRLYAVRQAIVDTPAQGRAGLAVKLRLMRLLAQGTHNVPAVEDVDFDWEWAPGLSALRDAERLAGGEV